MLERDDVRGVLTLALLSAVADGRTSDGERAEIKRISESLGALGSAESPFSLSTLWQDVLLKKVSVDQAVAQIKTMEARELAYEISVCICDADGAVDASESAFLAQLRQKLQLSGAALATSDKILSDTTAMVAAPLAGVTSIEPQQSSISSVMTPEEHDKLVLNYSILNGALEILPDSLATMAIIPLQMKMVYRIGKAHNFDLDRTHIKDFLATAGVGLTSQYIEQIGTRLVGGLLKAIGGKAIGGLAGVFAKQAVSSGFSFATTWALGQLARRYYAGGRKLSGEMLRQTYTDLLSQAKGMQKDHLPAIQNKARTINVKQLLSEVGKV